MRTLRELGVQLVPIRLPDKYPIGALTIILNTEAASVFDELTRSNVTEGLNRWPNAWRRDRMPLLVRIRRQNQNPIYLVAWRLPPRFSAEESADRRIRGSGSANAGWLARPKQRIRLAVARFVVGASALPLARVPPCCERYDPRANP